MIHQIMCMIKNEKETPLTLKERMRQALETSRGFTERLLADFDTPDQWLTTGVDGGNHPLWIAGHLAVADNAFVNLVSADRSHPRESSANGLARDLDHCMQWTNTMLRQRFWSTCEKGDLRCSTCLRTCLRSDSIPPSRKTPQRSCTISALSSIWRHGTRRCMPDN